MGEEARTGGGGRRLAVLRARIPPPLRMAATFVMVFWAVLLSWAPLVAWVDARLFAGDVATPFSRVAQAWLAQTLGASIGWPWLATAVAWGLLATWIAMLWSQARSVMLPEAADRAAWWGGVAGLWFLTLDWLPLAAISLGMAALMWARQGRVIGATAAAALAAPWLPGGLWFALAAAGSESMRRAGAWAVLLPPLAAGALLGSGAWLASESWSATAQRALLGRADAVAVLADSAQALVASPLTHGATLALFLVVWLPGWVRSCALGPVRALVLVAAPLLAFSGAHSAALALVLATGVHASFLSVQAERSPALRRVIWFGLLVVYALLSRLWMGG